MALRGLKELKRGFKGDFKSLKALRQRFKGDLKEGGLEDFSFP